MSHRRKESFRKFTSLKPHTNSITKRFSLLKGREVDRNLGIWIDIVLVRLLQRKRINEIYRDV